MDLELWRHVGENAVDEITGGGWLSSYTGLPISREEMDEYGDNILKKLEPFLHPGMKVLEIGCASGISMFRIAPKVGLYYGTDLSEIIIEKNRQQVREKRIQNIQLACLPAHEIDQIPVNDFDLVIINSVIQCFHGHNYLRKVLKKAVSLLGASGYLFIGDVMNQEKKGALVKELTAFKEANRHKGYTTKTDFSAELFVSPGFWQDLRAEWGEIETATCSDKLFTIENELTKFRYDVLLTVNKDGKPAGQKFKYQDDMRVLSRYKDSWIGPELVAGNLAYIIYTSGSTGKPKGVMVEHRSLANLCTWHNIYYSVTSWDRATKYAGFGFDASVWEFFPYLVVGASICVVPEEIMLDMRALNCYYEKNGVTIGFLPTQVCEQFMELDNRSLRILLTGGDKLKCYIKRDYRLYNNYGPTENTVVTTSYWVKEKSDNIPIGRPVDNNRIYIFDRNNNLKPVGVPGELCIGGDGLARGYLNNPELTAGRFSKNCRSYGSNRTYINYKTGDLARWLYDGHIEFLGRIDQQVKIRGFRIELGEIEARLSGHYSVKEAVVIDRKENDETYLCAYIVSHQGELVDPAELGSYLSKSLPGYMIPNHFIQVDHIPLAVSGKVDKRSLPAPRFRAGSGFIAPANDVEIKLAHLWSEVLAVDSDKISMDANFFQLGGHSLKATVLVAKMHKELNVKIPLAEIFTHPTPRELARCIQNTSIGGDGGYSSIERVEEKQYYELSPAQKRIYILYQMAPESMAYNISGVLDLQGIVDKELFEVNFKNLIDRHESFRTDFQMIDGEPFQVIHNDVEFKIESLGGREEENLSKVFGPTFFQKGGFIRPFDLSKAPLLRVGLLKIGEEKHLLAVDMSHIIADGVSLGLLIKDFAALFAGRELPGLKLRYRDYSVWQNRLLEMGEWAKQWEYWKKEFEEEIPALSLPTDFQRPLVQVFEGGAVDFETDANETSALKRIASERGMTLYMMILSLFYVFLAKMSGQEDIVVGTPVSGRTHAELEYTIGMFVNTLALRNYPAAEKPIQAFLLEIKQQTLAAFGNQDFPFDTLAERLGVSRDLSRNPLFDVMFEMQNMEIPEIRVPGLIIAPYPTENRTAQFDLTLSAVEQEDFILLSFKYCSKLFREETICRFTGYFKRLISTVLKNLHGRIGEMGIIPEEERAQILYNFNDTANVFPVDKTMPRLFEEQASKSPNCIALVGAGPRACPVSITYLKLNEQSDHLSGLLIEKGVLSDKIVGIMMERSIEMAIGILSIWKAGGAYLPIDPEYPHDRVNYMLRDSGAYILLTDKEKEIIVNCQLLIVTCKLKKIRSLQAPLHYSNLAYIIYTSGSTGKPKGAMVEHIGMMNHMWAKVRTLQITSDSIVAQTASHTFDISVWQFFVALIRGGRTMIYPGAVILEPMALARFMVKDRVTVLELVPSYLAALLDVIENLGRDGQRLPLALEYILVTGEEIKPALVERWFGEYPGIKMVNAYGPTEASDDITQHEMTGPLEQRQHVPIGKPLQNFDLFIVNEQMQLCPVGIKGEICVSGIGVGRGYLNRPELTADKFYRSYRSNKTYSNYKTGDLGRWLPDGTIEFFGRKDYQVKIRGFRIELGEIENLLASHPGVKEAVVIDREEPGGEKYLCAYYVPASSSETNEQGLKDYLSCTLPDYMTPAHFVEIEKVPLTPNGKIDRKALPSPVLSEEKSQTSPLSFQEKQLAEIWAEVLNLDIKKISIDDGFFELGGQSLKAILLSARIQKTFHVNLTLVEIFNQPTIRKLAHIIKQKKEEEYLAIEPAPEKPYYDVSSAQKRLYILQQLNPSSISYNAAIAVQMEGDLDIRALEQAFKALIQRHEVLRTGIEMKNGLPVQVIHKQVDFHIEYEEAGRNLMDFIRPFDLSRPPLMEVLLVKAEESKHILLVDIHHIITDGVSNQLIARDFTALYSGRQLPPLKLHYRDFSEWQNNLFAGPEIKKQEEYWLQQFEGEIPQLNLPLDYPRPAIHSANNDSIYFRVNPDLTKKIKALQIENGTTAYMVLLAVYSLLISRYADQDDIIVGSGIAGRRHADLQNIVGMFVNMLVIRLHIQEEMSFLEFLDQVREHAINAFDNQDYQFDELVNRLGIVAQPNRNPLFDTQFTFQDAGQQNNEPLEIPGITMSPYSFGHNVQPFDLDLNAAWFGDDSIELSLNYLTSLFKRTTIENMAEHFMEILEQCLEDVQTRLKDVNLSLNLVTASTELNNEEVSSFEF
jgi:fengycin family lipopeptide synthetase D